MNLEDCLAAVEPIVRYQAFSVARRYGLLVDDAAEELCQVGRLAVVRAHPRYDGSVTPGTFFQPRIRGAMLDALRGGLTQVVRVPRTAPAGARLARRNLPRAVGYRDPEPADAADAEFRAWLIGRFGPVGEPTLDLLTDYFARGRSSAEIGAERGQSRQAVAMEIRGILNQLAERKELSL